MTTKEQAMAELEGLMADVKWYQDQDLDYLCGLCQAGNYEEAYAHAAALDEAQCFCGVCDTGYYISDFHKVLALITGHIYKIKNCTPHEINILDEGGFPLFTLMPEELPARLKVTTERVGTAYGIPLSRNTFGEPDNLPEPEDGVLLIVSAMIKTAFPERADLAVPTEMVRDSKGVVLGCKSLGL